MDGKTPMRFAVAVVTLLVAAALALPAGARDGRRGRRRHPRRAPAAATTKPIPPGSDRDPFLPLVAAKGDALPEDLPPGKAGLIIGRLQLEGLVHTPRGVMAVVSTPHGRVFFLRPGDRLYDGKVTAIGAASASFREVTRDAYGRPLVRAVTLRLHSSGGE
jgi:hypothetical protein